MASSSTSRPLHRDSLTLRVKADTRGLIDRAAHATGTTVNRFVLDAARRAAEDALLDRSLLIVSPEAHAAFIKRLDEPANPNPRLRKTLATKAPWD